MEFIENNYVWIIVIGVIVLMTIIGYFADKVDKTDKTEKVAKPKKEKKEKKQKKNQDLKEEIPEVEEPLVNMDNSFAEEWDENSKPIEPDEEVMNIEGTADTTDWDKLPDEETPSVPLQDNNEFIDDEINWDTEIANDVVASEEPIFTNSTENVAVQPDEEISMNDNESSTDNIDELPIQNDEEVKDETPVEIQPNVSEENQEEIPEQSDDLDDLEITLPNIETLNAEIKDVDDDEDVWKF